jgi:hypothetical protein
LSTNSPLEKIEIEIIEMIGIIGKLGIIGKIGILGM